MQPSWVAERRAAFHQELLRGPLTITDKGVPSNADSNSKASVAIARNVLEQIGAPSPQAKQNGQAAGAAFEAACETFLNTTLSRLSHLRRA